MSAGNQQVPPARRKLLASPRRCVGGTGEWSSVAAQNELETEREEARYGADNT